MVIKKKSVDERSVDEDNDIIINNSLEKKSVKKATAKKKILKKEPVKKVVVSKTPAVKQSRKKVIVKKCVNRNRVASGIQGFDKLIQGGFPEGFVVLIAGTPGTGKTLFGLEYLYKGAEKFKEKSMLITFEQSLDDVRHQASCIGLDLVSLEKKGMVTLMHIPITDLDHSTLEKIKNEVKKRGVKRLVVDSISTLAINAPIYEPIKDVALKDIMSSKAFFSPPIMGDFVVNRFIYGFIDSLRRMNCTTLLISEASEKGDYISRDTVSEFIADGVLSITFESMGGAYSRSLIVRKMRGTKNDEDIHPLEIGDNGLVVHEVAM